MNTEAAIEQEIQDKGLNAPRLTPKAIDEVIIDETFTTLPSGKAMVCELTLRNGFTVRGEAATVSKENFDIGIGKSISRENARRKVWEMEGYLLQQRLHDDDVMFESGFDGEGISALNENIKRMAKSNEDLSAHLENIVIQPRDENHD